MGRLSALPQTILAFFALLTVGKASVQVDVRCYCNLPACATTARMCRSSTRMCLSERSGEGRGVSWRHACLEFVLRQGSPQEFCAENGTTRRCCEEDMCNYPKKGYPDSVPFNHSHVTGYLSNHDTSLLRGGHLSASSAWFRVAVAAVPMVGGAVLLMLIVMATKMLKSSESSGTRSLGKRSRSTQRSSERKTKPLQKSLSCVVLDRGRRSTQPVVRTCASMSRLNPSLVSLDQSMSVAFSIDSGCSDSSRNKYFVFDV